MKKSLILFLMVTTSIFFIGCNSDDDTTIANYASFEQGPINPGVEVDGEETVEVMIYTTMESSSAREFGIMVDESTTTLEAESYSVPQTVTVPGGAKQGIFTINLYGIDIDPINGEKLGLRLIPANDEFVAEDAILNINVSSICPFEETTLSFIFDGYASETTWEIQDEDGTVVYSGGDYEDGDTDASSNLCLGSGNYTLTVFDAYGDGLTFPTEGSISVTRNGETLAEIPGNFESETSVDFTVE